MLPEIAPKLSDKEILLLIEDARNAELCRDLDALRNILQRVWNDNDRLPTFTDHEPKIRAELLRLYGFFLTTYGISRNLKNFQSQGKDLLTNAIEIFQTENLTDKAAEANVILAFCYWNSGEVSECEAILSLIEEEFRQNQFHPVSLQIRVNRLMIYYWKKEYTKGIKLIKEISQAMSLCSDLRLKAMFHNQAGVIYRKNQFFEDSAFHFSEAVRFATKLNNLRFIAANYNNLSLLYLDTKKIDEAHSSISKSITILAEINDNGFLPHALDTKALIYIDENKYEEALKTIDEALGYFNKGEDYSGLTDAIWTKIRCLLRLGQKEDALISFAELEKISSEQIGEVAVKKFAKNLSDEIYTLRGLDFADEVVEFRKERVSAAMVEAKGVIGKAAKILGLKNHQALSDMLHKQFPGLLNELGFQRRARRNSVILKKGNSPTKKTSETPEYWEIIALNLDDKDFSFDFEITFENFETYFFDRFFMQSFGIETAAVVAVATVTKLEPEMVILGSNENQFFIGKAQYDEWTGIYFVEDVKGNPIPFDIENLLGQPVGFCPASDVDKKHIRFSRLVF